MRSLAGVAVVHTIRKLLLASGGLFCGDGDQI